MFKKKKKNQPPKEFDIHRTLPRNRHPMHQMSSTNSSQHSSYDDRPNLEEDFVQPKKRRFGFKRALISLLLIVFCSLLFVAVWDARNFSHASNKMFGSGNLLQLLTSSSLKGSSQGRVNVLIAGYSADDPAHPGANLTDSIMLLSMSTTNHTGYMLSIPRDLYVHIPGFGYAKINEAYQDGGMSLLEQVVTQDFGTPIDYYALVDYATVRDTVNALGGITVNVQSTDPRGFFDPNISPADGGPLKLANGSQILDGQTALNFTRARGDPCACGGQVAYGYAQSDFTRTQNQRLVFSAIKSKVSWKLIFDPRKNGKIFDSLAANVKTDLQLSDVRPLYQLFSGIPTAQLQSISLNKLNNVNLLAGYTTPYGQSALIPAAGLTDFSQIDAAITQLNQQ